MKKIMILLIVAFLFMLCWPSLEALMDFTIVDTWDLGNKVTGYSTPLSGTRCINTTLHTIEVYDMSPTAMDKVQTLYTPDMISGWYSRCIDNGRLYISTQYTGVLVYQILPDQTLSYLGKIPLQSGLGGLDYNDGVWAFGDTMVVAEESMDYVNNEHNGSYIDVYDISDISAPQFIMRHQFQPADFIVNVTAVPGGYYLTGFLDAMYFTPDLATFQQVNMQPEHNADSATRNTFYYMGKLHCLKYYGGQQHLVRYTINPDHTLSQDWALDVPQVFYCDKYLIEQDRVCLIGSDSDNTFLLISYVPSDGVWTQEYVRPWTGGGIHTVQGGYVGHGAGRADFYDQQLNYVGNICVTPYQRAVGLIADRWVMFRGLMQDFGSQPLTFYDLVNRQWLDLQTIKTEMISRYRRGTDYFCVADGNTAQILRFQPDGSCQVTNFTMPHFCYGIDLWGDRMAVTHVIGSQMVLKVYDISSGAPVEIGSQTVSQLAGYDVLFYDADHIVIARIPSVNPSFDFFRLESSGSLTSLANIMVVDYDQLYVEEDLILAGRVGGAVIDVSDPDDPHICAYTDPMVRTTWGSYISHEGNNYLFSDSMLWLSYITDSNFHVLDTFISEYSWYRSPNHILMQSWNTLFEVEHQPFVDTDDPVAPELANPLGLPCPNPFRDNVKLDFELRQPGKVRVDVYNIKGQKVRGLENGFLAKGRHELVWNGRDDAGNRVSAGVYILRLGSGGESRTRRLVLMK
jgi:hypothetical protein